MKRLGLLVLLWVASASALSADSTAADSMYLKELKSSDVVRTEKAAERAAVRSLDREPGGSFQPVGVVLQLTRARIDAPPINRGDLVWLVSLVNAGASSITPIPDGLVWVRAKDGAVAHLVGSSLQ